MSLVIFEIRGEIAHFRRPDTMGTQATYPFITRTALRGLAASILGRDSLPPEVRCGLRLLSPVRTIAQEMTMHGKSWVSGGDEKSFHRPTAIELVVKPHYRVYYEGPLSEELGARLQASQSHYHTYLGSAFCLTFPEWVASLASAEPLPLSDSECLGRRGLSIRTRIETVSVVPSPAVKHLLPRDGDEYARVGGILWEHLGDRRFRGTTSLIYEVNGRALCFIPVVPAVDAPWNFCRVPGEGDICLW